MHLKGFCTPSLRPARGLPDAAEAWLRCPVAERQDGGWRRHEKRSGGWGGREAGGQGGRERRGTQRSRVGVKRQPDPQHRRWRREGCGVRRREEQGGRLH
ncbi:hypothetical protein E2C01_042328 [Portunus trituberculatus]|uniref:Uncharacterized protein n=1 Tax=Portunus trituberculatus TaxID=210409 RepID=A0A5B7FPX8_PORTR|nr:hypothetical protein [Portunus trituberculatus]